MKEKLEVIREMVNELPVCLDAGDMADKCLHIIKSLIAELESDELVEKVASVINNSHPLHGSKWDEIIRLAALDGYMVAKGVVKNTRLQAKAAVNVIKGI